MVNDQLLNIAERLTGEQVIVKLRNGEEWPGLLNSVKIDTKTYEPAIELLDDNGKGLVIPLKNVTEIKETTKCLTLT